MGSLRAALAPPAAEPEPGEAEAPAPAEAEFLSRAIQDYQGRSGRMFPTWNQCLKWLEEVGYAPQSLAALTSREFVEAMMGTRSHRLA